MRLLLTLLVLIVQCASSEVQFGEVKTLLSLSDTFPSLDGTVITAIQQSVEDPNVFWLGANRTILTARLWPESQQQLEVIAGNISQNGYREGTEALFRLVTDIVKADQGLIVTDAHNECLRLLEPPTVSSANWKTSTYAGRCQVEGFNDGVLLNARFNHPIGLLKRSEFLFVTDRANSKLRQINMKSEVVTTVHQSDIEPFHIVPSKIDNGFYVTVEHGILKVNENKESWLVGWSSQRVQREQATFSSAGFGIPVAITWLEDEILMVTDFKTTSIKVINIIQQKVDVLCPSQGDQTADGDIKHCGLAFPLSLFVVNNTVLIADYNRIRSLDFQLLNETKVTVSNDSTTSTTSSPPVQCDEPPSASNAIFEPLESYPEGSTVYYQCTDNYVQHTGSDNKQVCAAVNGELRWINKPIACHPTLQMVTASVLAAICICTVIAIVVAAVKIRSINKQLEEATDRQTRVTMATTKFTNAGSGSGCSNQSFNNVERKNDYYNCRNPTQHISTSPHFTSVAVSRRSKVPKPAPRRTQLM